MSDTSKGFTTEKIDQKFEVVKVVLENKKWSRYRLKDGGYETKQFFLCPECKKNNTYLSISDSFFGLMNENSKKIITCLECSSKYFVQTGYREPNYGRDVFYIAEISLIKLIAD